MAENILNCGDKMAAWVAATACWDWLYMITETRAEWLQEVMDAGHAGDLAEPHIGKEHMEMELLYLDVYVVRQCGLNRFGAERWTGVDDLFLVMLERWLVDLHGETAGLETYQELLKAQVDYMGAYNRMLQSKAPEDSFQDFMLAVTARVWGGPGADFRLLGWLAGRYADAVLAGMDVMKAIQLVPDEAYVAEPVLVRKADLRTGDVWVDSGRWDAFSEKGHLVMHMNYLTGAPQIRIRRWPDGSVIETFQT